MFEITRRHFLSKLSTGIGGGQPPFPRPPVWPPAPLTAFTPKANSCFYVFQGRYKSIPIKADSGDPYYFRIVADYIHLNPARAGLAGGSHGKLCSYKWSSIKAYESGKGPDWLVIERVIPAFKL